MGQLIAGLALTGVLAAVSAGTGLQGPPVQQPRLGSQERPVPEPRRGQPKADVDDAADRQARARRKLDSHLLEAIERFRRHNRGASRPGARLSIDRDGRALVEIRGRIPTNLARKIARIKGTVVSTSLQYRSVVAWVPLRKLEALADEPTVSAIAAAPKSTTSPTALR